MTAGRASIDRKAIAAMMLAAVADGNTDGLDAPQIANSNAGSPHARPFVMTHPRRKITINWTWLLVSLLLTAAVSGPVAYVLAPRLIERHYLAGLAADNAYDFARALRYVTVRAPDRQRVLNTAIETMSIADDARFVRIQGALTDAGLWKQGIVGDGNWLRWLGLLATDADVESRIAGIQMLGRQWGRVDPAKLHDQFAAGLDDNSPLVRQNILLTAAQLAARDSSPDAWLELIIRGTKDDDARVAAEAWRLFSMSQPTWGVSANWREAADSRVAQAILLTSLRLNPQSPEPAIEALRDATVPVAVRAAAAYALSYSHTPAAQSALRDQFAAGPDAALSLDEPSRVVIWRSVLACDPADEANAAALATWLPADDGRPQPMMPIRLAALNQLAAAGRVDVNAYVARLRQAAVEYAQAAPAYAPGHVSLSNDDLGENGNDNTDNTDNTELEVEDEDDVNVDAAIGVDQEDEIEAGFQRQRADEADHAHATTNTSVQHWFTLTLAALDGLKPDAALEPGDDATADPVRLMIAARSSTMSIKDLRFAMSSTLPTLRDHAVWLAANRLPEETLTTWASQLMASHHEAEQQSGSLIAGLAKLDPVATRSDGQKVHLLPDMASNDRPWTPRQHARLGLWLRGDLDDIEHIEALALSLDMPASTVLMAWMEKDRTAAMNWLLRAHADEREFVAGQWGLPALETSQPVTLRDLLVTFRWQPMFQTWLPESAPPFWTWADPDLQALQLDELRDWWLIQSHRDRGNE